MATQKWIRFGLAATISLALCTVSGILLLACMKPMEDRSYDLSLVWEGESEGMPQDWVYDQKGWTVFTQDGDTSRSLTPDGSGGFNGLEQPGKTFYFSRVMNEKVDSPTLRLQTANYSVTVFLDGDVIYTDCPEQDNRIGYLELPMLESDREDPVLVTLPADYIGKTLTIAQSTAGGEQQEPQETVWPCSVTLYCGYVYESHLITESFQTVVPVSLAFAAGVLLSVLFTVQAFRGIPDQNALCGGLLAFFWLARQLDMTFLPLLHPDLPDISVLARDLALTLLLVFLALHMTGRRRLFWLFAVAQFITTAAVMILQVTGHLPLQVIMAEPVIGLAGLLAALVFGILEWKHTRFFQIFCPLMVLGIILWTIFKGWHFDNISYGMLLWPLAGIMTAAALATALTEAIQAEIAYHTELSLLSRQNELTQASYEAMRWQNDQVMILRHDMMKHFHLLRQITGEEKTAQYLDELIGQNEKIHPIVQSGNEMLNIILNNKLSTAADAGIQIELTQTQAPEKLPMSDSELCSLIMNIIDNAVNAASMAKRQYIRLDMHIRNNFFVFTCENAATLNWIKKENVPGHGLGLKIIRQIMKRYGNLINTEYGNEFYKVTVLLPLRQ